MTITLTNHEIKRLLQDGSVTIYNKINGSIVAKVYYDNAMKKATVKKDVK